MRVLIACSYSAKERDAFRALGHDAWSADFEPCEGDPTWHYQGDVFDIIGDGWDLMVGHPPCTYLTNSGVRWLWNPDGSPNVERWENMRQAAAFFRRLWTADIPRICLENPIPHRYARQEIGTSYTQCTQPWWFGEPAFKATCYWLKGLPPLTPTNRLTPPRKADDPAEHKRWSAVHLAPPGPNRWKDRSRAFDGVVNAVASQFSRALELA